jgi:hypothetical protein
MLLLLLQTGSGLLTLARMSAFAWPGAARTLW